MEVLDEEDIEVKSMGDLPAELMDRIFQLLDKRSQMAASLVNLYWKAVIHTLCWQAINTKVRRLQLVREQLTLWGWQEAEHTPGTCHCIQLHLQPLVGKVTKPRLQETRVDRNQSFHTTCAITNTSLFVGLTSLAREEPNVAGYPCSGTRTCPLSTSPPPTQILVFDRHKVDDTPRTLITFPALTEVHLYCHENTLVLLQKKSSRDMFSSIIRVSDFKVSLWDTRTLSLVKEIDFLPLLPPDLPDLNNVHTEVSDVALAKNSLAIHIFVTNLDWLLPDEILQNPQSKNITMFWSLDTRQPKSQDIHFKNLLRKSLVEGNICDTGFIFLNRRFFLRYLSGLFCQEDSSPRFTTKVQVFSLEKDRLDKEQAWIVDINQVEVLDFADCNDDSLKLEQGESAKLSAFNVNNNTFKIIDIVKKEPLLFIDLSSEFGNHPLFSSWQMHDSNWLGGNFLFLRDIPQMDSNNKLLRLMTVSEEEVPSEPFKHFHLGAELGPVLQTGDLLGPGTKVHVDLVGVVLVTEDFLVNASFLDGGTTNL